MTTIYLAGPINGCNDDEANGWRDAFRESLPGFVFRDPMERDYRGSEDESVDEIVRGDKEDIGNSNGVVAYCWQPSWGTAMEIYFAWCLPMRPFVYVVVPEGQRVSPWLRYHSDAVVPTLAEAAHLIRAGE